MVGRLEVLIAAVALTAYAFFGTIQSSRLLYRIDLPLFLSTGLTFAPIAVVNGWRGYGPLKTFGWFLALGLLGTWAEADGMRSEPWQALGLFVLFGAPSAVLVMLVYFAFRGLSFIGTKMRRTDA